MLSAVAVMVGVPSTNASSVICVRFTATAKPLLSALTVGVAFAVVFTSKSEDASSDSAPVEARAPVVSTNARVLLVSDVAAIAAASVCGPAAVAMPSVASVGGFNAAPAGVEFAMVVSVPPAVASMSMLSDCVTRAASSMNASVVAMITGDATVVPTWVVAAMPLAVAATMVLVAASSVKVPPALTAALSERWLRAVVLMTGAAMASSPTAPVAGVASTVALTLLSACAVNEPDALMIELPVTATFADSVAANAAVGTLGSGLVTLDTSPALAMSVMSLPLSVAPLMVTPASTS